MKYYTTTDVASMLGLHKTTIKAAVERGEISAIKSPGGHARIPEDAAREYVESKGGTFRPRSDRTDELHREVEKILLGSTALLGLDEEVVDEMVDAITKRAVDILGG